VNEEDLRMDSVKKDNMDPECFDEEADLDALAQSSVITEHLPIRRNGGKRNGHGNGRGVARQVEIMRETLTLTEVQSAKEAKVKGYEGDPCQECKQFTMVRNGTCLKCVTCGATSGCS
jgi:ribonucleoside-diphosphate reductase alpha chain